MISRELQVTLNLAVNEARRRRHEFLTLEHVLFALLHDNRGREILQACGGDRKRILRGLEEYFESSMETLPDEGDDMPEQTLAFQRTFQRAAYQVQSSGQKEMDAGNILASMFRESDSHAVYLLQEEGIARLDILNYISHGIRKDGRTPLKRKASAGSSGQSAPEEEGQETPENPLEAWCTELVEEAREGRLDPLIGRTNELERTIHILARRRKNNPLFIGEPGVGKTALVEGLAQRIASGDVPPLLKDAKVYSLDMGSLLAGTRFRGDFEERFKSVMSVLELDEKAILFIDEIHTVVGAGATSGGNMDASNMLKPALAKGKLRCMGSTTFKEFRKSIENDRALARRFQPVNIDEPSLEETVEILKGLKPGYEEHHGVTYTDDALQAAAKLSDKHLRDRFLPDKAVDVMDEAGATIQLKPNEKLVDVDVVEATVARMAKIPAKSVSMDEQKQLENLEERLKAVIYGQDLACEKVAATIRLSRAGLGHTDKPIGSFLFAGPTGVGKTELAKQLAFNLGVEFQRFDMSEYMESHSVSRLLGAPPGYVGYDEGGQLTDAVKKHPHSVVLLDEIEKAHPRVYNVLLQIMDHGTLTDAQGKKTDFRNVIIIMTTNAGASEMSKGSVGFVEGTAQSRGESALNQVFTPEFRNRLDGVVWFDKLPKKAIYRVVDKFIIELEEQLGDREVSFRLSPAAREWLADKGYDPAMGARPMARVIHKHIKEPLADEILFGKLTRGGLVKVDLNAEKDGLAFEFPPKELEGKERPALTGPTS
ncbi:MAG: ATP-dependent Clp protease ATP-binding subunit ClpA [Myxococcota bacterium]|nr:ATP-dependent Clp protease ATP-binding subunit ClpA [Myxococcota bacterium]